MALASWFLVIAWIWLVPLMHAVAGAEEQQGEGCSSSARSCGNLTISDPFWLTNMDTRRSCGSLDFEVNCFNNTSAILQSSIPGSFGFAIVNISYQERNLHVVDQGKLQALQAPDGCQVPTLNTSAKVGRPFRISPINLNLVLYNCTSEAAAAALSRRGGELVQIRIRCGNQSEVFVRTTGRYNETSSYDSYEGCNTVIMPVLISSGEANTNDYEQLISDGFLLTWAHPLPAPARSDRRGKKIMLIGTTSAAATFLFACLYVLIWHRKGKRLWFLLCKKGSSNTEKNYEAMIVSYGSLAPKRYMHSELAD
ncbi:uncharacterized protein [Triticum aestivum]|uniref:uncharacterized protein n=1 Tax=Triticum aestivum TaxID=4565 RepID=UPI001D029720|nr:uncharacterized protein LOC123067232 [Triticum aestivum]